MQIGKNMTVENSGGSCSYYEVKVKFPTKENKEKYIAECNDIIHALDMNISEANIFKEIWRLAAARQGKQKKGNTTMRGWEKIKWMADTELSILKRKQEAKTSNDKQ